MLMINIELRHKVSTVTNALAYSWRSFLTKKTGTLAHLLQISDVGLTFDSLPFFLFLFGATNNLVELVEKSGLKKAGRPDVKVR